MIQPTVREVGDMLSTAPSQLLSFLSITSSFPGYTSLSESSQSDFLLLHSVYPDIFAYPKALSGP